MRTPKFLYFDLGNVLLTFDVEQMCRQMADVAGIDPQQVKAAVFESQLQHRYELGEVTSKEFHEAFCQTAGVGPDLEALACAASDIFQVRESMLPVIAGLKKAGYRLGVLSNTCDCHWEHCLRTYPVLQESFEVYALSYKLKAAKPDPKIFRHAARLANVECCEVFFTDDILGHVEGAKAVGFDAVQFVSTEQLVEDLRNRGVRFDD